MREIKFRAYDKFAEKMMDDEDIGILPSNDTIGTTSYGNVTLINVSNEHYVIMQYTGLKDKNSVEIYEGDIISRVGSPTKYYTAKFDLIFGLRFIDSGEYYVMPISPTDRPQTRIVVVGNIYQNPELLI